MKELKFLKHALLNTYYVKQGKWRKRSIWVVFFSFKITDDELRNYAFNC
jgi:hypothetical protein